MICVLWVLVGLRQTEFGLRLCLLKALSKFILGHNKLRKNTFSLILVHIYGFVEKTYVIYLGGSVVLLDKKLYLVTHLKLSQICVFDSAVHSRLVEGYYSFNGTMYSKP